MISKKLLVKDYFVIENTKLKTHFEKFLFIELADELFKELCEVCADVYTIHAPLNISIKEF